MDRWPESRPIKMTYTMGYVLLVAEPANFQKAEPTYKRESKQAKRNGLRACYTQGMRLTRTKGAIRQAN